MRSLVLSIVGLGFGLAASTAMATPIKPPAYDMPNGNTGAFNYWDESYGGTTYNVLEPAGADPFAFTVGGLAITNSSFDIQLIRQNAWTFMSEVEFDVTVPLPAPVFMPGGALAAMGIAGRARRRG